MEKKPPLTHRSKHSPKLITKIVEGPKDTSNSLCFILINILRRVVGKQKSARAGFS